jgi:peptidoglycan/LPS O-acetylase OafA/YrhL
MRTVGSTALSVGFSGILIWALSAPVRETSWQPLGRGLAYIGLHSYSIYLWRIPVPARGVPVAAILAGKLGLRPLGALGE